MAGIRGAGLEDAEEIAEILAAYGLPDLGFRNHLESFWVAEAGGRIVGVAGLEVHGDVVLLRSVATRAPWRGRGVGAALCRAALASASVRGAGAAYLLTTDAQEYFTRLGFEAVPRAAAPPGLLDSAQLREGICSTAILMVRRLA